jgi:hypothetical protein
MTGWIPDEALEWQGRPVARTVADAAARAKASIEGVVRNVVVHRAHWTRGPAGERWSGASLDAWLDDGTGTIVARWVGREAVPGVHSGARISVQGTVAELHGHHALLNPLYRFEASVEEAHDASFDGSSDGSRARDCPPPVTFAQEGSRQRAATHDAHRQDGNREGRVPDAVTQDGSSVS